MTQPERPDRAARDRMRQDRVAAQLRQAARSYEPDTERIRRMIEARSADVTVPVRTTSRRIGSRTVLWPALGSAAAAGVILAVAAAGAPTSSPEGPPPATSSPASAVTPTDSSSPSTSLGAPTSDVRTVTPTVSPTPTTPRPGSSPTATGPGPSGSTSAPGSTSGPASVSVSGIGGGPVISTGSNTLGSLTLSTTVRRANGSDVTTADLGAVWAVVTSQDVGQQQHAAAAPSALGLQPMTGATLADGPFRVKWQSGTPRGSGTSSLWLRAPGSAGQDPGVRVPVRYQSLPATARFFIAVEGGTARLRFEGEGSESYANLPKCTAQCLLVVDVAITGAPGKASGDLTVDVQPTGAAVAGLAAATLHY